MLEPFDKPQEIGPWLAEQGLPVPTDEAYGELISHGGRDGTGWVVSKGGRIFFRVSADGRTVERREHGDWEMLDRLRSNYPPYVRVLIESMRRHVLGLPGTATYHDIYHARMLAAMQPLIHEQHAELFVFLREVVMPYFAEEQGAWDSLDGISIPGIKPDVPMRRGTRAFRMRQRLEALLAGRSDPGPGPNDHGTK